MIYPTFLSNLYLPPALSFSKKELYGAGGILFILFLVILILVRNRDKKPEYIKKLLSIKFPEIWRDILTKEFPIYESLPIKIKENLNRHIQVFIGTKEFEGVEDLEITQEIRLSIAAQASLLICNVDSDFQSYRKLGKIFVYPDRFLKDTSSDLLVDGVSIAPMIENNNFTKGEIFLSWKDVKEGVANGEDGYNPVFHQFAHQLDQADLEENGVPTILVNDTDEWKKIWNSYLRKFKVKVSQGKTTVMDQSAAESMSEFFAVATEYFFEVPLKFKKESPGLYGKLMSFYNQDPASY